MKNIAVYFANFNPINLTQIEFLKIAKKEYSLDEINLIPLEQSRKEILNTISIKDKLKLCELAIKKLNYIKILENNTTENFNILKILKNLKEQNKDSNLFLIVWPYFLQYFVKLFNIEKILEIAKITTISPLKIFNKLTEEFPNILIKPFELNLINSKKLRIMLALNKDCSEFLTKPMLKHIKENKLYYGKESLYLECYDICKKNTSFKRFAHCNFVSKAAEELAKQYNENTMDAKIAGLMHDVMKEKTKKYMLNIFKNHNFKLSRTEAINPKVWHGIAGAIYMEKILGIDIKNIINAVKYHTVPRKDMTTFEKIIFIADRISKDRIYKDVVFLRKLAKKNLDEAVIYSLKNTIGSLLKKEGTISTPTVECYNKLILNKKWRN